MIEPFINTYTTQNAEWPPTDPTSLLADLAKAIEKVKEIPPPVEIVECRWLGRERRQVCFPRSRRKRIKKKWRRDPRNWKTTWKIEAIFYDTAELCFTLEPRRRVLAVSPAAMQVIRDHIKSKQTLRDLAWSLLPPPPRIADFCV